MPARDAVCIGVRAASARSMKPSILTSERLRRRARPQWMTRAPRGGRDLSCRTHAHSVLLPALNNKETALSTAQLTRMRGTLARALSTDDVNELGLQTGQSERLRTITPHRLFLSTVAGLAGGQIESLADLLREFNHQNDVTVAYKAFYNRLAHAGFAKFMHQMFGRLIERLCIQTLAPEGKTAVSRFKDIVIQDGSSFALKNKLRDVFPGRFTTIEPAAVEIHATYSGFSDEVCSVQIAPDKEANASSCMSRRR
jgi:hypothetical protein